MKEKARAVGVSFPPELHARVVQRAERSYGGNVSAYVQRLTTADLDNKIANLDHDPDVLGNLAKTYAGYMAPQLAANVARTCALYKTTQPAILHRLLQILADATEGEHPIDPEHMTIMDDEQLERLTAAVTPYPERPAEADAAHLAAEPTAADTAAALKTEAATALRALARRKRGNGHPPAHTPPPTVPTPPQPAQP
jgi:hypothetical protein